MMYRKIHIELYVGCIYTYIYSFLSLCNEFHVAGMQARFFLSFQHHMKERLSGPCP